MITSCHGNAFRITHALGSVTRSFDLFFDLCLNKQLSKQSWGWWFETPPCPLRRHRNVLTLCVFVSLSLYIYICVCVCVFEAKPLITGASPSKGDWFWCFLYCWSEQAVEQIVELLKISDVNAFILFCCYNRHDYYGIKDSIVINIFWATLYQHLTPDRTLLHYSEVIKSAMASQITGISIVCSAVCSG